MRASRFPRRDCSRRSWSFGANQIELVNLIVDPLTEHGVMNPALYESPFTDVAPHGPSGLFNSVQVVKLIAVLARVRESAAA
jgi:type I restriction enzyme, R subunit